MLTIDDEGKRGGHPKAGDGAWSYNFVSQMSFRQAKICEKERINVNLSYYGKPRQNIGPEHISVH